VLRALLLTASAVALLALAPGSSDLLPDLPNVSTLAGSGAAGITDGAGSSARFEGPQGLSFDRRGNLYVADTPAQRIRTIDARGVVTTLAGSGNPALFGSAAPGGYRDGAALQAQFNGPSSVAVASDGALYVADTNNHCIRKIQGGRVSTFAGSPSRIGHADGSLGAASFTSPRSVAVDTDGTVYVTDYPGSVRRVSRGGAVSTMRGTRFTGATSLAIYDDGKTDELLVGSPDAIGVYDLHKGPDQPYSGFITSNREDNAWRRTGQVFVGPPAAIAAIDAREFVYADALFSTVRLVQMDRTHPWHGSTVLGAEPLLNAANRGGGFRDGPGNDALYNEPTGVAVGPTGTIVVADTGNKRIRKLSAWNRRSYTVNDGLMPDAPDPHAFRIAIVGHSVVWQDISWRKSIPGTIESRLCAARAGRCNVEMYPMWVENAGPAAMTSYIKEYLADGLVNVVIYVVPTPHRFNPLVPDEDAFGPSLEPLLRGLAAQMKASDTKLLVAMLPNADQMPNEESFLKFEDAYPPLDPGLVDARYTAALDAVKKAQVPYVDLWPAFYANDARLGYQALYRTFDPHLTDFGNGFVGNAIADALRANNIGGAP
jgi:hypothetical protein